MIDGIKLFFVANEKHLKHLKSYFDFIMRVANSGELVSSMEYAYYRGLKISIRGGRNVTIQGSLHKAFNNGINYNDFYYKDVFNAVQIIINELGVDAQDIIIQRIEFGVNIYNSKLPFSAIENNLLLHRLNPFMTYLKGNIVMGFYCKRQRYELKIYNKSIQENLADEVLRLEYKVTKMQHLKSLKIHRLSDLLDEKVFIKIGELVYNDFMHLLMDNCEELEKANLTQKESNFYLKARNVKYWSRLKRDFSQSTCTSHKRRFQKLIKTYASCDLTTVLSDIFLEKWQTLLNNKATINTLDKAK